MLGVRPVGATESPELDGRDLPSVRVGPVTAGATTPEEFPTNNCNPHHRPTACGPASRCVIAHRLEVLNPNDTPESMRNAIDQLPATTSEANAKLPAPTFPHTMNVLRTTVAVPPDRIQ